MKFEKEIIDMYNSGYICNEIALKLNCCISHIYNVLRRNNVQLRNNTLKKKQSRFNVEDINDMYALYIDGMLLKDIGSIYGVRGETIGCLFRQKGYKCRNNSNAHRKYYINEHFFDNIDS